MTEIVTRDFGGSALVRDALAQRVPEPWYLPALIGAAAWRDAARAVAAEFTGKSWYPLVAEACAASGAAAERLARVAREGGVVVTTGQQPGLFGGPIYAWSKAFTALQLANDIERKTGVPTAPVFWAATDDADFTEASYTVVARGGDAHTLRMPERDPSAPATAMAATPLGDVSPQLLALAEAAGSAIDPSPLNVVRAAYAPRQTVGGAYVTLLRTLLEPLGIAVLDASHPAVRAVSESTVRQALRDAGPVRDALAERSRAIEAAGYRVQVQPVPNLSLVFHTDPDGSRRRVPLKESARFAATAVAADIGPNVLLRPVVERQILPTVSYVAGPAEFAYFAQVSAVADVLGVARPRVVPRWSGLVLEPHVRDILCALHVTIDDFRDPHAIEGRVAREELPAAVRQALHALREAVTTQTAVLRDAGGDAVPLRKAVGGFEAQVEHRIARLERRYAAAVKRSGNARLHEVAVARASLFPNGVPQERALNMLPFLARYGEVVRDGMLEAAGRHAGALIGLSGVGDVAGNGNVVGGSAVDAVRTV